MAGNILIIEDDEELLYLVKRAFELNDFKVFIAKSIGEGFEIFQKNKIDIIFADVVLKDGNMIERLNDFLKIKKAKVILTTGYSDITNVAYKDEVHFFIKPYDIERIIDVCFKMLAEDNVSVRNSGTDTFSKKAG